MSTGTEARLKDALTAVGDTLESAHVPALEFAGRRRSVRLPLALGAVAAVAAGAAVVASLGSGSGGTVAPVPGSGRGPVKNDVTVVLCVTSSPNPNCNKSAATQEQKRVILDRLMGLRGVRTITYESQREALDNFRHAFAGQPGLANGVQEGDIPDSYRVSLVNEADAPKLVAAVKDLPGVDRIQERRAGSEAFRPPELRILADIGVFLCTRTSVNLSCTHRDVTPEQRAQIERRLKSTPGVVKVEYVPRSRNVPDSFQVTLAKWADSASVANGVANLPGVEQVVNGSDR